MASPTGWPGPCRATSAYRPASNGAAGNAPRMGAARYAAPILGACQWRATARYPVGLWRVALLTGRVQRCDFVRGQGAVIDVYLVDLAAPEVDHAVVELGPTDDSVTGGRVAGTVRHRAGQGAVDVEQHLVVRHVAHTDQVVPHARLRPGGREGAPTGEAEREHVVRPRVLQEELAVPVVGVLADRGLEGVARIVDLHPRGHAVVAGGVEDARSGVGVLVDAVELERAAAFAGHRRRPVHERRVVTVAGGIGSRRPVDLIKGPVADAREAWGTGRWRRRVLDVTSGREHRFVHRADPRRVDLQYPAVVGHEAVELAFDVGGLGVDRPGQGAAQLTAPDLGRELHVAVGQLLRRVLHLVGEAATEPHVAGHGEAKTTELAVDDGPAVGGQRVARAYVRVVVVDVTMVRVRQRGAAVLAAFLVHQPTR